MPTHRSLDGDFWTNPRLRSRPWHYRLLTVGLVTQVADDEGRFDAEPMGLLDAVFSRQDPVTLEDVQQDLSLLVEDQTVLLYGPRQQFGFLCAWYRRQIIDKRHRRPSTRPEPPFSEAAPITSWEFLDALAAAKAGANQKSKVWPTVVCREFCALPKKEQTAVRKALAKNGKEPFLAVQNGKVPPDSDVDSDSDVDGDVDGKETPTPSAPPATADDASSEPAKDDTLAQKLAKASWALFGQEGTPPGNVFAAAQQLVDAHGDKCKDLYRHIRDTEDRDLKGAKPGTKVAAVLRSWISEGKRFLWDPSAQPRAKTAGGAALPLPDDDPDPFHAMQRREGVRA
jgi:hypothetical protein